MTAEATRTAVMTVAAELIEKARTKPNGLATAMGARSGPLRQVIAALRQDAVLPDHVNPGDATLHCLLGAIELISTDGTFAERLGAGDLMVIPHLRHYVTASVDSAFLITQRSAAHSS